MSKRITIIVGCGFDRNNVPISATDQGRSIVAIQEAGIDRFGGLTITRGEGIWRDDRGKVVSEPCLVVVAVVDVITPPGHVEEAAGRFAEHVRSAFNQSSVVLTIDDCSLAFID